jgi:geranylgeranylglycerol-phosphate geranylgeranyltransferase
MSILQKSKAFILLIRPELPVSAGICVVIGEAIALGTLSSPWTIGLGFLLGFFLSSSQMIFNDYFDLEVDRINSPQRPLPSGMLSMQDAIVFGVVTFAVAMLIALMIAPIAFFLSLVIWILGFLYNWKLKAAGLWGNLIVSTSVAMTFVIGGICVGRASPMLWLFASIAFLFDLAEEIAGDAMDMQGDRKRGSKSIAIVYSRSTALRISGALFAVMIFLTFVPLFWNQRSLGYWIPIAIMDGVIIFFAVKLIKSTTPNQGRTAMRVLYISATLGLVAFLLSSLLF